MDDREDQMVPVSKSERQAAKDLRKARHCMLLRAHNVKIVEDALEHDRDLSTACHNERGIIMDDLLQAAQAEGIDKTLQDTLIDLHYRLHIVQEEQKKATEGLLHIAQATLDALHKAFWRLAAYR